MRYSAAIWFAVVVLIVQCTARGQALYAGPTQWPSAGHTIAVAAGDLDGDGDADLVASNYALGSISVFHNNGDATFAAQIPVPVSGGPHGVALDDVDGNGWADVVVTNLDVGTVSILLNGPDGLGPATAYPTNSAPWSVVLADVDGDTHKDLLVVNYVSSTLSVLLNNGDGTFGTQATYPTGPNPRLAAVSDIDGDGDQDIAVSDFFGDTVGVLKNNGNGTFAPRFTLSVPSRPFGLAMGDFDGDGDADIAAATMIEGGGTLYTFLNDGSGVFTAGSTYPVGRLAFYVAVDDANVDGHPDLLVCNYNDSSFGVLLGNGDGTFQSQISFGLAATDGPNTMAIDDLDGDGDRDLALSNGAGVSLSVFKSRIVTPECRADVNGDGHVDIADLNAVLFAFGVECP